MSTKLWPYLLGCLIGALLGQFISELLFSPDYTWFVRLGLLFLSLSISSALMLYIRGRIDG